MLLADGPILLAHVFKWIYVRALRRKYRMVNGIPQGINLAGGLVLLVGAKADDNFYRTHRGVKNSFLRNVWIDDMKI